jgi:hypothetical protein
MTDAYIWLLAEFGSWKCHEIDDQLAFNRTGRYAASLLSLSARLVGCLYRWRLVSEDRYDWSGRTATFDDQTARVQPEGR